MEHDLESLEEEPAAAWFQIEKGRRAGELAEDAEESVWEILSDSAEESGTFAAGREDRERRPSDRVNGERPKAKPGRDDKPLKDSVGIYLTDVRRFKLMTHEEEIRLTRAAQTGDREARDQIITRNLRLVISFAKRYQGLGLPLADLIEEGNLGLIRSIERFDWRRGLRFSTYSSKWIRQSITRALVNTSRTVRLPSNVLALLKRIAQVQRHSFQESGRRATHEELCKRLGISVLRLAEVYGLTRTMLSLDLPVSPDLGRHRLHDLLPSESAHNPAQGALEGLENRHVANLLNQLSAREQWILRLRFGFDGGDPKSLEETGKVLGVTRERIRQLEGRALGKLRRLVAAHETSIASGWTESPGRREQASLGEPTDRRRRPAILHAANSRPRGGARRRSSRMDHVSLSLDRAPSSDELAETGRGLKKRTRRPILRKTPTSEGSTSCGCSDLYPSTSRSPSSSAVSAA